MKSLLLAGLAGAVLLGASGVACAQSDALPALAQRVLNQVHDARAPQDVTQTAQAFNAFGHFIKAPPPPAAVDEERPAEEVKPQVKPAGTLSVNGQLRVIVGSSTFAVGDELTSGWRVTAITRTTLTIRKGKTSESYPIR